jgi:putative FmdB family regulatory protein
MTYTYKCSSCNKVVKIIQRMNDDHEWQYCPKCKIVMHRVFDVPTIKFIGKGFYCNDYKKEKK